VSTPLMPTNFEERATLLAVARFRIDRRLVERAATEAHRAQAEGKSSDLIDVLVEHGLLNATQANELRELLDIRHDLASAQPLSAEERPTDRPSDTERPTGQSDIREAPRTKSGFFLRNIGEFRVLRRLGEGGMGTVFLGYDPKNRRQVAIKVLADQLTSNPTYLARFHREARTGATFDHPNVVRFLTAGHDPESGKHYLVMEYVDGPSARTLLTNRGKLAIGDAIHLTLDILHALEYIHARSYVHRDIKPDNILITRAGIAKLADLGLAKCLAESGSLTDRKTGFGTPYYMPCEQALDATTADSRCDIYSLGATLYHLVTGEVPFPGRTPVQVAERKIEGTFTSPSKLNPAVPSRLERIIVRMLARDPNDRYQTVPELIADLEATGLNLAVPSFVNADQAVRVPATPGYASASQETRPDLGTPVPPKPANGGDPNVWYLRYRDGDGQWCKSRATKDQLVQRLRHGQVPDSAEVSRIPGGVYLPLISVAEFRDVVPPPPPAAAKAADNNKPHPPSQLYMHLQALVDRGSSRSNSLGAKVLTIIVFLLLTAGSAAVFFYFNR
jgi:eukaryotic-like serine/threonine-protein kinase